MKRNPIPKLTDVKRAFAKKTFVLQIETKYFSMNLEKILSSSEIWLKRFVNQMNYLLNQLKSDISECWQWILA